MEPASKKANLTVFASLSFRWWKVHRLKVDDVRFIIAYRKLKNFFVCVMKLLSVCFGPYEMESKCAPQNSLESKAILSFFFVINARFLNKPSAVVRSFTCTTRMLLSLLLLMLLLWTWTCNPQDFSNRLKCLSKYKIEGTRHGISLAVRKTYSAVTRARDTTKMDEM